MPTPSAQDRAVIAARLKGYLNKHEDSVAILTTALETSPDDIRLLRWRGHRSISIRDFEGAITDLTRAAELLPQTPDEYELYQKDVEPDAIRLVLGEDDIQPHHPLVSELHGTPAAAPYMSSLHTAVWYHLGVAQYLDGRLSDSVVSFARAYDSALHYEGKVAALDWQYMILRRLGRDDEAAGLLDTFATLADEWDEAGVGYDQRMRLYRGELDPAEIRATLSDNPLVLTTLGYGLGNWYHFNGDVETAHQIYRELLDTGARYAFAYMAAESDLAGRGELATTS